jgi:uncharacterized repeat protein (TIGR03803 family)
MRSALCGASVSPPRLFGRILVSGMLIGLAAGSAHADFKVLHAFTGGADGSSPAHTLLIDKAGNLYGTTEGGGAHDAGTVFEIAPDGTKTILYSFGGGRDGDIPEASLLMDGAGNLYGTTFEGGIHCRDFGCGTAFKLAPDGTKTTLYAFLRRKGENPLGQLIESKSGDFYVAARGGGDSGGGSVLKLLPDGTANVLHDFGGGNDGASPSGVIRVGHKFYGTTEFGGAHGTGTVFKLVPPHAERVVHSFGGAGDGATPTDTVTADDAGNLYGMTFEGGAHDDGTVYKIAADGTESVLYSFKGGDDGANPTGTLTLDASGNLYGVTAGITNCGTVFKLAPDGSKTTLHQFNCSTDGFDAWGGLTFDAKGRLYGTTRSGGPGSNGVVFRLTQ